MDDFESDESLFHKELIQSFYQRWPSIEDEYPQIKKGYDLLPKKLQDWELNHEKWRQQAIEEGIQTNWQRYHEDAVLSDKSFTPLHFAAKDGLTSMAKSELENQANANMETTTGLTPLHLCANFGHLAIAELLLKYKANVSALDNDYKLTPLHYAAESGHKEMVELLIENGAKVNASDCEQFTPLHLASKHGHTDIMELLIGKRANVNAKCSEGTTPLFGAAMFGHEDAAACLIRHKCNVNDVDDLDKTALEVAVDFGHEKVISALIKQKPELEKPLLWAVWAGRKEIAEMLLSSGANVNYQSEGKNLLLTAIFHQKKDLIGTLIRHGADFNYLDGTPLTRAVNWGFADIVEALLEHGVPLKNKCLKENCSMIHLAAKKGHIEVATILLKYGDNVDALTTTRMTPLAYAAGVGNGEMVEFLLANGANSNFLTDDGTALHIAATHGHQEVVAILLSKGAEMMAKDQAGKTALEYAVSNCQLGVVEVIANHKKNVINEWASDKWTYLHIATQRACEKKDKEFEMVKLLVAKGANLHTIAHNYKPVHIATREGPIELVEFFLSQGNDINKDHLLNHAAVEPNLDVVKFLIARGADINAEYEERSPLLVAASAGHKELVELLLSSGVVYHAVDFSTMPGAFDELTDIVKMLMGTASLFEAVGKDYAPGVVKSINIGAYLNAKNPAGETALCMAARMGLNEVLGILLKNGANPNIADSKSMTPLHYAVQRVKVKNVTLLLGGGAIYDARAAGKTPADISKNKAISALLALVDQAFKKVNGDNRQVINDLKAVKDPERLHAVFGARNIQCETLMSLAVKAKFSKIKELRECVRCRDSGDEDVRKTLRDASTLSNEGKCAHALIVLESGLRDRRRKMRNSNDTHTLTLEYQIGMMHFEMGLYAKALELLQDVFKKQKEILTPDARETLETRGMIALVLHRLAKYEEAHAIFREVAEKQKKLFGETDEDYINTIFHMALALVQLGRGKEALAINEAVYKHREKRLDPMHPTFISTKNNYAQSLQAVGRPGEAYKIFDEVLKAKMILYGPNHGDTCRTMNSIAGILAGFGKLQEALQQYLKIVDIHKKILPPNTPETLVTQYNIVSIYMELGELFNAYNVLSSILKVLQATFGPTHTIVLDSIEKMTLLEPLFGDKASQKTIIEAMVNGDFTQASRMARDGHANDVDNEGRTALHFATDTENLTMVHHLLTYGADATIASKKGNTALHTAASKANVDIVQLLLQKVNRKALASFINAKTSANGTTAMHVAASKEGSLPIIKLLLKNSAIFNVLNNQGKTPLDLAKDASVREFLQTIRDLFKGIAADNANALTALSKKTADEIIAITRARNVNGITLYQVALDNGHQKTAQKLLGILQSLVKTDSNT